MPFYFCFKFCSRYLNRELLRSYKPKIILDTGNFHANMLAYEHAFCLDKAWVVFACHNIFQHWGKSV